MLKRSSLRQGAQLALPNLPQKDDRDVGASQAFDITVGNRALSFLGDVILNIYYIRPLFEVVNIELSR